MTYINIQTYSKNAKFSIKLPITAKVIRKKCIEVLLHTNTCKNTLKIIVYGYKKYLLVGGKVGATVGFVEGEATNSQ